MNSALQPVGNKTFHLKQRKVLPFAFNGKFLDLPILTVPDAPTKILGSRCMLLLVEGILC